MNQKVVLTLRPQDPPPLLLFEKIGGIPLLLRNILALQKMGCGDIGVALPIEWIGHYSRKIAPNLKERGLTIEVITYDHGKLPSFLDDSRLLKIPAHTLIHPEKPFSFHKTLIEDLSKLKMAQKQIAREIRFSTPGPIARLLNKRISLPISLGLASTGIHPNWVTLINMMIGIGSGLIIAEGTYFAYVLGAFLFQMASILDGCDGEIAKLTFRTSKFGQYFDTLSDNGALISFFLGLIAAYAKSHTGAATYGTALLLLTGLGLLLWQMIAFLKSQTESASLATFDKEYLSKLPFKKDSFLMLFIQKGKILVRKDFFSFAFFLLALLNCLPVIIYLAIIGTWSANGILVYVKLKQAALAEVGESYES